MVQCIWRHCCVLDCGEFHACKRSCILCALKFLVLSVWSLDTAHQVLVVKGEIIWAPLLTTVVALLTQGFFVYRIRKFCKKMVALLAFWSLAALYQLGSCLVYSIKATRAPSALVLTDSLFTPLTISYFAVAAVVDIIIAVSLSYKLLKDRSLGTKRCVLRLNPIDFSLLKHQ
ncbi:hypothetical protein BJ138DRAFT_447867 [Hygrophoropsis aurantiaca]|uniref:Uncharacterized protein n=1 Tax=Hygrophoropsis aurantiaca TaxID=72124 RepID=A0ACB8AMN0_9AGAM|nr:hypothetical protein BJ138DRAFT_447867 [Hygrophoropsis aurantiaca]